MSLRLLQNRKMLSAVNNFFDDILEQDDAVTQLKNALEHNTLSHAYLFVGAQGLGKTNAARAIAAGVMCKEGGCKKCAVCMRLARDTHPDFRLIEPEGPQYSVDQIRTIIHDATLAPMEAEHKFYLIYAADLFNDASANAFLKTLEEPSPRVTFILIAHTTEAVLPTIVSRCLVVRFKTLPQQTMVQRLCQESGCTEDEALIALGACGSVMSHALAFITSPKKRMLRNESARVFRVLKGSDDLDIINLAHDVIAALKGPLEELEQKQEAELVANAELLSKKALDKLGERNKRRLSAFEKQSISEVLNVFQSLLRDTLCISQGANDLVLNVDESVYLADFSRTLTPAAVAQALRVIDEARARIALHINTQLVLETTLFGIREVL